MRVNATLISHRSKPGPVRLQPNRTLGVIERDDVDPVVMPDVVCEVTP